MKGDMIHPRGAATPAAETEPGAAVSTLHPYVIRYLAGRVRRGELNLETANNHRYALFGLAASFGNRPLNQLGGRAIERWLESKHLSIESRRNYICIARLFCSWLLRERLISLDPLADIRLPRRPQRIPQTFTEAEIAALFAATSGVRERAIVALMIWCGPRCVEVSRLNVEDWDTRDDVIIFRGKGNKDREVTLPDEARPYLLAYLKEYPATVGPFFRSYRAPGTERMSRQWVSRIMAKAMFAAGIKYAPGDGRGAHGLRRTCATDVLEESGDLVAVQELLGHANLDVTTKYLRRADRKRLRQAMAGRRYSPALAVDAA